MISALKGPVAPVGTGVVSAVKFPAAGHHWKDMLTVAALPRLTRLLFRVTEVPVMLLASAAVTVGGSGVEVGRVRKVNGSDHRLPTASPLTSPRGATSSAHRSSP